MSVQMDFMAIAYNMGATVHDKAGSVLYLWVAKGRIIRLESALLGSLLIHY